MARSDDSAGLARASLAPDRCAPAASPQHKTLRRSARASPRRLSRRGACREHVVDLSQHVDAPPAKLLRQRRLDGRLDGARALHHLGQLVRWAALGGVGRARQQQAVVASVGAAATQAAGRQPSEQGASRRHAAGTARRRTLGCRLTSVARLSCLRACVSAAAASILASWPALRCRLLLSRSTYLAATAQAQHGRGQHRAAQGQEPTAPAGISSWRQEAGAVCRLPASMRLLQPPDPTSDSHGAAAAAACTLAARLPDRMCMQRHPPG